MPAGTFEVNCPRTFAALVLMASSARTKYGTAEPDLAPDGRPRWELSVAATWLAEPGRRAASDVMAVTVIADRDPSESLSLPCAVELDGLRLGVSTPQTRDNGKGVSGGKPWYQAEAVRAAHQTGRVKAESAA